MYYFLHHRLRDLADNLAKKAEEGRADRDKEEEDSKGEPEVSEAELVVPKVFKSAKDIDLLVAELTKLKSNISRSKHVRITWKELD